MLQWIGFALAALFVVPVGVDRRNSLDGGIKQSGVVLAASFRHRRKVQAHGFAAPNGYAPLHPPHENARLTPRTGGLRVPLPPAGYFPQDDVAGAE